MTPTPDKPAGEALKAALPDYIELWRIIRKAGRSNAAKAQAVADHLDSIATRTPPPSALDDEVAAIVKSWLGEHAISLRPAAWRELRAALSHKDMSK